MTEKNYVIRPMAQQIAEQYGAEGFEDAISAAMEWAANRVTVYAHLFLGHGEFAAMCVKNILDGKSQ